AAAPLASSARPLPARGPQPGAPGPPRGGGRPDPAGFAPPPGGLQRRASIPARAVSIGVRSPGHAGAGSFQTPPAFAPNDASPGARPFPVHARRPPGPATI